MQIDIPAFEDFADGGQGPARITAQVVKQANELVVSVYANMGDVFEGTNFNKLRMQRRSQDFCLGGAPGTFSIISPGSRPHSVGGGG